MSKDLFWVGQRVRLISPINPAHHGALGTIAEQRSLCQDEYGTYLGYLVKWDDVTMDCGAEEAALEPVYDGDQASTWDECAWIPPELRKVPA